MKKLFKIMIICILLSGIGFWVYKNYFQKDEKIVYITQKAELGTLTKRVEASGEIFATELIDVGAQVGGQIKKLYVKLGDNVKQGDLIAEIDSSTQQNMVDNRKAQLFIYEAQLNSAKVEKQTIGYKLNRIKSLFEKGASSKQNLEDIQSAYASINAKVAELEAQIRQAKIALNTARIDLGYTKIIAPKDGTIIFVAVEEGQTLNSVQSAPTIVNIADLSRVKMKIQIAEGDITKIKVGANVSYTILSEPNKTFSAKISSIDPALTTLSNGRYSTNGSSLENAVYYYAQSIVDNPSGLLRIGMSTQNSIDVAQVKDAVIVPALAIKQKGDKKFISILKQGDVVEEREVKVGISNNLSTQIISGIDVGDNVITSSGSESEINSMVQDIKR
ncbi:macrolide-specific efflux protein, membrane fusion protein MacA [Campylobacter pinnipediorum subsp. caledonicus]|uniref:Macrolide-specific efflux protein, membrane fusion protein MacA n=1 Tax=Campylobacter pinnipediorum subsp. caledonicus TaxID=1874362 RepID=A0A1S6U6C4_9BACT|nr:efflux RND transporter periplasmic adaptor subunit [Campylobacter pinnipediorum]AQW87291.1 macrolide-specific efflux protein, membrane fusion protein MacA [Campylobacter pinnipediorum subsp. caledonicus]OPA72492.1 efflux transporter periplasmic adaptor subunit [Campylobacter pinnipediorum subsp. caledonicus]